MSQLLYPELKWKIKEIPTDFFWRILISNFVSTMILALDNHVLLCFLLLNSLIFLDSVTWAKTYLKVAKIKVKFLILVHCLAPAK